MNQSLRAFAAASIAALALTGCTEHDGSVVSAKTPLHLEDGALSIDTASAAETGALSSTDWSSFNAKVTSVSVGAGLARTGPADAPKLSVIYGDDYDTATMGNDPRLSDPRAPLAGSDAYIQNGTTPQAASFNLAGSGTIDGGLQATYLTAGPGTPLFEDLEPGTLALMGKTTWGLEPTEATALQIIDRTDSIRRGIFDTSGNVYFGGDIACVTGCSAGISYRAANRTTSLLGAVQTHDGFVQHDAAFFESNGSTDASPVQLKTSINAAANLAFRFTLEGYNWGADAAIDSLCVGRLDANGLAGKGCTDRDTGATASLYVSTDGFLVIRVTSPQITQAGFSLSAAYYALAHQDISLRLDTQVIRSASDL